MLNLKKIQKNKGMTYVELIVVLSIFAIMTSIVMFNYGAFQAKVDIKRLANDIALQIVQAQKDAMSGKWDSGITDSSWKPAYGVDFSSKDEKTNNFIYFADSDNNNSYFGWDSEWLLEPTQQSDPCPTDSECLSNIRIKKTSIINQLRYMDSNNSFTDTPYSNLSITFTRPKSEAVFYSGTAGSFTAKYVEIIINSAQDSSQAKACIQVYPSGRIQIKCTE